MTTSPPRRPIAPAAAAVVCLAALTVTGCATTVPGTANLKEPVSKPAEPTRTPTPLVTAAALPQLLIDLPTMQTLIGSPALETGAVDTKLSELEAGDHYTPPECLSTMLWGQTDTYAGLHATDAYGQTYKDPGPKGAHAVAQMIVLFPDPVAATTATQRIADQWRACTGRQVTETRSDGLTPPNWTIGDVVQTGAVTTMVRRPDDSKRWACARFMAAKSNAVVDGLMCSYDIADRPGQIANAILAKIAD
ncbi:sensor domain-containing protein [Mycolicibacterium vinylchloridicum]|uniref:sensor domain-containing protein n=1 Tax=Mycolicibacterium vinylchloridicum TaxID=2736928 RepID=UPI00022E3D7E|nr:sensor domain-containing protein [Mycolicibacterium vinylchloridicum]EHB46446.1 hypothetical protein MycrhDRAFT_6250 [Mycolicibacterium rhodesiae JS60]